MSTTGRRGHQTNPSTPIPAGLGRDIARSCQVLLRAREATRRRECNAPGCSARLDVSETADYAFQYALTVARPFDATLYLLHVIHFAPQIQLYITREGLDHLVKEAEAGLKEWIEKSEEQ